MKYILTIFCTIGACVNGVLGCSTFFLNHNGQMLFGRNYDWVTGTGMVNINLRGLEKISMSPANQKKISWVSRYGSVTFNQYGKEFPTGGMNEKGLVIELMWLSESKFPDADRRPAMNVLQWIQYQLDNASTIDEVIASDKNIRIVSEGTPQHYLVADARGLAATIEFLDGRMVVHRGNDLPYAVLTNSTYRQSLGAIRKGSSHHDNSLQRFATACSMVSDYKAAQGQLQGPDYAFDILQKVSMGEYTKWSIVYDIGKRQIYFKSSAHLEIRHFSLQSFDFACDASPRALDINKDLSGEVAQHFTPFSTERNAKWLRAAVAESSSQINIPAEQVDAAIRYPSGIRCH